MTTKDVQSIFNVEDIIIMPNNIVVTVDDFLNIAEFQNAPDNPTKQELLDFDNGEKGYVDLIESGNYS